MTALLPCPFCGAEPYQPREDQGHHNDGWWVVCCSLCDANLPGNWTKDAAITAWNGRHHAGEAGKIIDWIERQGRIGFALATLIKRGEHLPPEPQGTHHDQ